MRLELLRGLIEANLAAAAAILLIVLLRRPVRRAAGPRVAYGLWALAPVAAIGTLMPARTVQVAVPQDLAVGSAVSAPLVEAIPSGAMTPVEAAALALDVSWAALGIWVAGAVLMFGWLAFRQGQFLAELRAGRAGPAVVGMLRPRIVLPSDFEQRFTPREQSVVLAHEKAHLARQDARINALAALCRCLFWFNPMVHIAAYLMRVDQELACDAAVLLRHPKARRPYAEALLKAQLAARPLPLGCYWPASADHPLTERIALLRKPQVGAARVAAGAAGIMLLAAGGAVGAWAAQPPNALLDFSSSAPAAPAAAVQLKQPPATPSPHLAPLDRIRVTVAEQPVLSREVTIDRLGMIRLPLTGDVKVAGLTPAEAAIAIEAVLGENLLTPKVSIVRLPRAIGIESAPSGLWPAATETIAPDQRAAGPIRGDVCLTNACAPPLTLPATPKTVQEAISAGQAYVVRDLGGTPAQALEAVDGRAKRRLAETGGQDPGLIGYAQHVARFSDTSDGSTLTFTPASSDTPDALGLLVVGAIQRRSPSGQVEVMHLLDNGAGRLFDIQPRP